MLKLITNIISNSHISQCSLRVNQRQYEMKIYHTLYYSHFQKLRNVGRFSSYRLTLTVFCEMNLHMFPFDKQACPFTIESCKYNGL